MSNTQIPEINKAMREMGQNIASKIDRLQTENEAFKARERVLVGALEATLAWYEAEDDHSKCPNFYKRIEMCRTSETLVREALASVKGSAA
jgi:hypothetical protein